MNKIFKFIIIFFASQISNILFSWDSEAAKYFPLNTGNSWTYYHIDYAFACEPVNSYKYKITIISDSVINGHRYFKFSNGNLYRIDSNSMNVYTRIGNSDCLTDSLLAKIGDQFNTCSIGYVQSDTNLIFFGGQARRTRGSVALDSDIRRLMYGIGLYSQGICLYFSGGINDTLKGCVINGIVYGDTTFTPPDTSLITYLPLKVGNIWVYYGDGGSPYGHSTWFDRFELTSTVQSNGKTYYNFDHRRRIVYTAGTYVIFSPRLFSSDSAIRIDSLTLNTYTKFNCGGSYESLADSLKASKNDTFNVCGQTWGNKVFCYDTAYYNIFGFNLPSKYFSFPIFESENSQTYVKNFGICRARISYVMEGYTTNLRGCVINGVVYGDTSFTELYSITGTVRYRDNNQNVTSGYVKAYRHSYQGYMDVLDSAVIQPNGTYTLTRIPPHDTTDLMAFQNDEITTHDFVPTYFISTIYWQEADHLLLNNDTSGIDIRVYRATNDRFGIGEISGGVYGYYNADAWKGISDARLYAVSQSTFRSYDITGETGTYSIDSLASGFYQIICNRIGFPTQTRYVDLGNINRNNINFYFDHLVAVKGEDNIPVKYSLYQNYPNPFNPTTSIKFQIPEFSLVSLKIYDVLGREVTMLINEQLKPGSYDIEWDASNYPSGVYFYKLESGTSAISKKMVLIK